MSRFAKLQLLARQLVEGLSSGLHRSPHKGASVTFKQHRAYVPGDELRHLDWRAFARSDRFYIKEYEQETNLQATLLLDLSGSMAYAGKAATCSKADYAREMARSLAALLIRQQDAVGVVTFDSKIRGHVPPRSRPGHLRVLDAALEAGAVGGETSLSGVLRELGPRLGRRSLVLLLSDCLDEPSLLVRALAQLRQQQHEVLVFQILDRDEVDFPFEGWTRFEALEIEGEHVLVDPATLRRTYLENLERHRSVLREGCRRHRVSLHEVTTDVPVEDVLPQLLTERLRRR
jgi:uncharacterized protein (DUF58 family)